MGKLHQQASRKQGQEFTDRCDQQPAQAGCRATAPPLRVGQPNGQALPGGELPMYQGIRGWQSRHSQLHPRSRRRGSGWCRAPRGGSPAVGPARCSAPTAGAAGGQAAERPPAAVREGAQQWLPSRTVTARQGSFADVVTPGSLLVAASLKPRFWPTSTLEEGSHKGQAAGWCRLGFIASRLPQPPPRAYSLCLPFLHKGGQRAPPPATYTGPPGACWLPTRHQPQTARSAGVAGTSTMVVPGCVLCRRADGSAMERRAATWVGVDVQRQG